MLVKPKKENSVSKRKRVNRLLKDYEAVCLKYEYPDYKGEYRYVIYTPMTKEELIEKHSNSLKKYEPYFIVAGELFREYVLLTMAEDRQQKEKIKHEAPFNYEDEKCTQAETQEEENASDVVIAMQEEQQRIKDYKAVVEALEILTPIQKRRVIAHFYHSKSSRTIAAEEGVNYSKVDNSINAALKKMKKHLEREGAKMSIYS